ncbi:peptidoglycan DD-metalloendopeptidase family protein [Patescibacteria group bacterium]|nr:peptidoglycan DD-metalloendopeptidase family protein [Patescibacteria group bacterium]
MKKFFWLIGMLAGCTIEWQPTHQYYTEGEIEEPSAPVAEAAPESEPGDQPADLGGANEGAISQLPFAFGQSRRCVQGAHDPFSHNGYSTRYDLDLDTSNSEDEEIYVPVSGVAYAHQNNPEINFGRHVNIDLGDGTYVTIAHFKEIFLHDGAPVAAGQLMGLEGCTGFCTGDHVHFGRHRGAAWEEAQHGESIPVQVQTENGVWSSESFVCGLENGQSYRSKLLEIGTHPNGTLVKSAHASKTYLLDQGRRRWITNQDVFWSRGYDFQDVIMVSDEELQAYPAGSDLDQAGGVFAAYDGNQELWLFVGHESQTDRQRQRVGRLDWPAVLASWGLNPADANDLRPYTVNSSSFFAQWPPYQGWATFRDGALLTQVSSSDVLVVSDGAAVPIETWPAFLQPGFRPDRILTIEDGSLDYHFAVVGSCANASGICLRAGDLHQYGSLDLGVPARARPQPEVILPDPEPEPESEPEVIPEPEPEVIPDPEPEPEVILPDPEPELEVIPEPEPEPEPEVTPDPEPEPEPEIEIVPDPEPESEPEPPAPSYLSVRWTTPFGVRAERITLSGEYTFADGSLGFFWHELKTVHDAAEIAILFYGAATGDSFRFSVEFADANGYVSWSCIGPYVTGTNQRGTLQGSASAHVDNQKVNVQTAGDPSGQTTGCGLIVHLP